MKKRIALILIFALIMSLVLVGCGAQQTKEAPKEEPKAEAPKEDPKAEEMQLTIITGSTGGTYYPLGGAMANMWSKYIENVQVTSQPGGASVESVNRVNTGDVDLGMAMNNIADDAWNGKGKFKQPLKDFRAIGVIYPEVYQGIAIKDSGIKDVNDLKGHKVAVGPVGSGTAVLSEAVLGIAGIDMKKDIKAEFAGFGDAASKIKDGQLEASFGVLSVPAAQIQDIKTSRDIEIIEIKGQLYDDLKAKYPFFSQYVIPAGTYGNEEDKYTVNCQAALYVKPDIPEEVVYNLTKYWYEKTSEVAEAHAAARWLADELAAGKLETAIAGISTPLHKGAYKYFQEKGIEVPEIIKPID